MPSSTAELGSGTRLTEYVSLGVIARSCPSGRVERIPLEAGTVRRWQRELPSHSVVYCVVALALYMQVAHLEVLRRLMEGLRWLLGPQTAWRNGQLNVVTSGAFHRHLDEAATASAHRPDAELELPPDLLVQPHLPPPVHAPSCPGVRQNRRAVSAGQVGPTFAIERGQIRVADSYDATDCTLGAE